MKHECCSQWCTCILQATVTSPLGVVTGVTKVQKTNNVNWSGQLSTDFCLMLNKATHCSFLSLHFLLLSSSCFLFWSYLFLSSWLPLLLSISQRLLRRYLRVQSHDSASLPSFLVLVLLLFPLWCSRTHSLFHRFPLQLSVSPFLFFRFFTVPSISLPLSSSPPPHFCTIK